MRKTILAIMLALALVLIPVGSALAQTSDTVTITATPAQIGISNSPDTYDFLNVEAGSTPNTGATNFTISNYSVVNIDIDIQCDGWTGGVGGTWTYATPAAADTGFLDANNGGGYNIFVQDSVDTELFDNVGPATNPQWGLELNAPTDFSYGDTQTTIITLTASVAN